MSYYPAALSRHHRFNNLEPVALDESGPVLLGILQIAGNILMPQIPGLRVVLEHEPAVENLELLDADWRNLVDRGRIAAESAELRLVLPEMVMTLAAWLAVFLGLRPFTVLFFMLGAFAKI